MQCKTETSVRLAPSEIIDRQPLISQRGNFSGKVSAVIRGFLPTEWWFNSPTTGGFQFAVTERSDQFHVPMGWVDIPLATAAKNSVIPTTYASRTGGTLIPRTSHRIVQNKPESGPFFKQFLWRTDEVPSDIPFLFFSIRY
mgnify:FL=1